MSRAKTKPQTEKEGSMLFKTPIAIIGMASLLPDAQTISRYWQNIMDEVDCIKPVPPDRWKIEDLYDPNPQAPDKTYSRVGGFIPETDFDPMEFGLPPNILEVTDVSQLLSLLVARQVLADAGLGQEENRERMGVTLGVGGGQKLYMPLTTRLQYPIWREVLKSVGHSEKDAQIICEKIKKAYIPWVENSFPGMLGNVIAGRIANRFNLGGLNCVLDAACGGGLAAVKMAVSELVERRADVMITGGVDTDNSPFMYLCFAKTPAMTKSENCSPFDEDSSGIIISEGIAMLALKRLEDAKRDNDRIYAVIRGIGTSSDGRFKSIYAPRPEGQALALERAYADAAISPSSIDLVEAHATGTAAGDAAEFEALKKVYQKHGVQKGAVAIGSVKSQIGHTKSTAGAAGLIKAALALHHKVLPPTINVKRVNPKFEMENSPFFVNSLARPWICPPQKPRRAAVSAFGFGGTNFHFVLEEYAHRAQGAYRLHGTQHTIFLSAPNPADLKLVCQKAAHALANDDSHNCFNMLIADSDKPLAPEMARLGFLASSPEEASEKLAKALKILDEKPNNESVPLTDGIVFYPKTVKKGLSAALFSGQGSQHLYMAREAACSFPQLMDAFSLFAESFNAEGQIPLEEAVYPKPVFDALQKKALEKRLVRTCFAQPAIGAVSMGLYRIFADAGFCPDFFAGHSFGELTALWAAGVFSDADFADLAQARGRAMDTAPETEKDPGGMAAVMGRLDNLDKTLSQFEDIVVANKNAPDQVVIAGNQASLEAACKSLSGLGLTVVRLPVSAAFHTPLVAFAQKPFAQKLKETAFLPPTRPVYANSTGGPYPKKPDECRSLFAGQLTQSVLFERQILAMYEKGVRVFVEFGPKSVLTKLVGRILGDKPFLAIATNAGPGVDSALAVRQAALQLRAAGLLKSPCDCFAAPDNTIRVKKSPLTVKLTGANFVSEKTRKAYSDSLNDGFSPALLKALPKAELCGKEKQRQPEIKNPARIKESHIPSLSLVPKAKTSEPLEQAPAQPHQFCKEQPMHSNFEAPMPASINAQVHASGLFVERSLEHFCSLAQKSLNAHEAFLSQNRDYTQAFHSLAQKQMELAASCGPQVCEAMTKSMSLFCDHQQKTLLVHDRCMEQQSYATRQILNLLRPDGLGEGQAVSEGLAGNLSQSSSRDSFKASSFEEQPQPFAEQLRQDISKSQAPVAEICAAPLPEAAFEKPQAVEPPADKAGQKEVPFQEIRSSETKTLMESQALTSALLEVVSEKTGYPAAMLDLSMDMEADLGIDSIKRVEILGALMEAHPHLSEPNPEDLAELKTLGQIVEHMQGLSEGASVVPLDAGNLPVEASAQNPPESAMESQALTSALLEVVSEKTGYPAAMLDLSMDMEADLGIDSIKRVEILGALMEAHPHLPEPNPEDLAELKTLGQIVMHMQGLSDGASAVPLNVENLPVEASAQNPPESGMGKDALTSALLEVVSEKTGYPAAMLDLSMDMEADLGIDSIKRVEILGALMEAHPHLPEPNPEDLAELKTLLQIVEHMQGLNSNAKPAPGSFETSLTDAKPQESAKSVVRKAVLSPLPPPDFLEFSPPNDAAVLVLDDKSPFAQEAIKELAAQNWQVRVLEAGLAANKSDADDNHLPRAFVKNPDEKSVEEALSALYADGHSMCGIVLSCSPENFSALDWIKLCFLVLKKAKPRLAQCKNTLRPFVVAALKLDGSLGLESHDYDPEFAGILGLMKTACREWEGVFVRAVDFSGSLSPEVAAKKLLEEIHDSDCRILESACNEKGRFCISEMELELGEIQKMPEQGVYLVSGGGRGVTARCISALCQNAGGTYILLGRSAFEPHEPQWAKGANEEKALKERAMKHLEQRGEKPSPQKVRDLVNCVMASREIAATINAINASGNKAVFIQADVTDGQALKQALAPHLVQHGPVTGIIHGAGVLADRALTEKTWQEWERVLAVKVTGLKNLLSVVDPEKLSCLALFSSAAGFYGNPGQADYAAANEILNKAAHCFARLHPQCRVASFNWGPIDGGMVTPELKKLFINRGVQVLPTEETTRIFVQALCSPGADAVQILAGGAMEIPAKPAGKPVKFSMTRRLSLAQNPFLPDHSIGGNPVLPTVCVISWMADAASQFCPGYRFAACTDYVMYKGVVFDKTLADAYHVLVQETKRLDDGSLEFEVLVESKNGGSARTRHYGAKILLSPKAVVLSPVYADADFARNQAVSGASLYKDGTLFHGPHFQAVEEVLNISRKKLTLKCRSPQIGLAQQGQFPAIAFNPFAADVHFQSMLIWVRHFYGCASLPTSAQKLEHYSDAPAGKPFFISLDVSENGSARMKANVTAHDEAGRIYTRIVGGEVTISKRLNDLFAKAG
jgi:acyl transferase domain-containing protein